MKDQKRSISCDSPDVIVATTGRLIDHIHNTRGFTLEDVELLILDEADRLIEMGFKEELMNIVKECKNPKRQTWFGQNGGRKKPINTANARLGVSAVGIICENRPNG